MRKGRPEGFYTRREPADRAVVLARQEPVEGLVLPYLDRLSVTRELTAQGLSGRLIALRLNCTRRTVERYRAILRNGGS